MAVAVSVAVGSISCRRRGRVDVISRRRRGRLSRCHWSTCELALLTPCQLPSQWQLRSLSPCQLALQWT